MDNFIEITSPVGRKELINIRHIISVFAIDRGFGMPLLTQLTLVDQNYPKATESYEEIKAKISSAITQHS